MCASYGYRVSVEQRVINVTVCHMAGVWLVMINTYNVFR